MLKKITFLCFIICLFFSCNEETICRIKINLSNLQAQEVYAVFESADLRTIDTLIYNGKGAFNITKEKDDYRTLTLYYENFTRWITVYLEQPQRIVVTGDALFPQIVQVKGGRINELLTGFRKEAATLLREYAMLSNNGDTTPEKQNGAFNIARLANINNEILLLAEAFIVQNPDEEASAILIRDYFVDPDNINQIENLLDGLSPKSDDFYVVKELKAYTGKAKRTIIGAQAPDFNVKNIYGKFFSADSLYNRYSVLTFLYLWNDMCHTNELHLDEIITSLPKDSLNVMLVSLDENPQELRDLLRKDPIRWNVVTDSAGQAIELLDLYNVNSLPRCFLLDKEGKIILKTDNGVELKKTLESLFSLSEN
jgi:peroxiredoxin